MKAEMGGGSFSAGAPSFAFGIQQQQQQQRQQQQISPEVGNPLLRLQEALKSRRGIGSCRVNSTARMPTVPPQAMMRHECNEDGLDAAITQGISAPVLYAGRNIANDFGVAVPRDASGSLAHSLDAPSLPSRLTLLCARQGAFVVVSRFLWDG